MEQDRSRYPERYTTETKQACHQAILTYSPQRLCQWAGAYPHSFSEGKREKAFILPLPCPPCHQPHRHILYRSSHRAHQITKGRRKIKPKKQQKIRTSKEQNFHKSSALASEMSYVEEKQNRVLGVWNFCTPCFILKECKKKIPCAIIS